MDLITHIPGITNSAPFTPGVNTPPPWHVSHTGLTDGTSPNNATKNMAQIYNRLLLERAAIIQAGGLTIDNNNWAQTVAAIRLMIGNNFGGLCPNTGPASPPTEASPYTKYKSALGEYWEWQGDAWKVIAGKRAHAAIGVNEALTASTPKIVQTFTCHRSGGVSFAGQVNLTTSAGNQSADVFYSLNGVGSARSSCNAPSAGWGIATSTSHNLTLALGDVLTMSISSSITGTANWGCGITYVD